MFNLKTIHLNVSTIQKIAYSSDYNNAAVNGQKSKLPGVVKNTA